MTEEKNKTISMEARYFAAAKLLSGLLARSNAQLTHMAGPNTSPELHPSVIQGFDLALAELDKRFGLTPLGKK